MKKMPLTMLLIFLLNNLTVFAQIPDWYSKIKQLKPIVSTKADVEKLFGVAGETRLIDDSTVIFSSYDLDDGWLNVRYSNGRCKPNQTKGYDVPEGTLIEAFFGTTRAVKISSLKVNLKGFYTFVEEDNPSKHYTNFEQGFEITVSYKKVGSVNLFPAAEYNRLRCERLAKQ